MSRIHALAAALLAAAIIGPGTVSAQESNLVLAAAPNQLARPGGASRRR
jgi:hypothetical protein